MPQICCVAKTFKTFLILVMFYHKHGKATLSNVCVAYTFTFKYPSKTESQYKLRIVV